MKESVTASIELNIAMVFIVVVFAFIGAVLSYYKAFKVNNIIADTIEKYEGYNVFSKNEIALKLSSLGYNQSAVDCGKHEVRVSTDSNDVDMHAIDIGANPNKVVYGNGYCVFYNILKCQKDADGKDKKSSYTNDSFDKYCRAESYNYIVRTYLRFDIPIVHSILKIPIYTKTNALYACYGNNC